MFVYCGFVDRFVFQILTFFLSPERNLGFRTSESRSCTSFHIFIFSALILNSNFSRSFIRNSCSRVKIKFLERVSLCRGSALNYPWTGLCIYPHLRRERSAVYPSLRAIRSRQERALVARFSPGRFRGPLRGFFIAVHHRSYLPICNSPRSTW